MPESLLHNAVLQWYAEHRRVLPWRAADIDPWGVLVSEVMLQQTGVARVLPVYDGWMRRWPTPAALAADSPGEAVRMWGRLGYPRRALRLHATATVLDTAYDGTVPSTLEQLKALPGVGDYTAAAVLVFAFRGRAAVLDTNVRRVLARWLVGAQFPASSVTAAERTLAESALPAEDDTAATWSVALMELGALVCTAASPSCDQCPIREACRWRLAGYPAYVGPPRRSQPYAGTDRHCRGSILALLRDSDAPVAQDVLGEGWPDAAQLSRALQSLLNDGLVVQRCDGGLALP